MQAFLKGGKLPSKEKPSDAKGSSSGKQSANIPWVEKYRPKKIDEVAQQEEIVAVLKKTLEGSDLPNMLFYGPPGTGKTSTILAAARELFGKEMYRSRILELNASDERGINVVRSKIKTFAQLAAGGTTPDGRPCPPFKIVILDEADSMTSAAQDALRRTIEKETRTTRFCLICNYVSRIIEPLTSRCTKFRFKPLTSEIQLKKLREISDAEQVACSDDALEAIISHTEGDLRKAITYLQSAQKLQGEEGISVEEINEIAGVIPDSLMTDLMRASSSGSFEKLENTVKDVLLEGYPATQILTQVHDSIVQNSELTDKQKSVISERLAVIDKRLCDGAEEYLQVMDLFTVIMDQMTKS